MSNFIPLSVPNISGNELKYVSETITTGWVSSVGSYVDRFEKEFAAYVGTKYAVAVSNGTSALHICLILSDVQPGDEVLVPNLTFVAPVNAIKYCFANPVFLDSDWETMGIDVKKLKSFIEEETTFIGGYSINKKTGAKIKAIIPMHALGYPVDMDPLLEICAARNIKVIEDATESLGTYYKKQKTGTLAQLACFSFNGNKIITTGGGGMITTNDEQLAKRAKHLTTTAKTDPLDYDHDEVGYNYRMVNLLAAFGVAQLERMEEFVKIKRDNLALYKSLIEPHDKFFIHTEPAWSTSNYWMYSLVLKPETKYTIPELIKQFEAEKIQTRPIWKLMNTLPMYKDCQSYKCDVSPDIRNRVLSIPCSTHLTKEDILRVVKVIKSL